jgi:hypothetical protein
MCLLTRTNQIVNRPRIISTATIVMGEIDQVFVNGINKQCLERLSGAFVQYLTALDQHGIVRHLLGERVLEDIFDLVYRRLFVNEFGGLQAQESRSNSSAGARATR